MRIIDSHCHLDDRSFAADFSEVLAHAHASRVEGMVIAGVDLATSKRAVQLANRHAGLFASVGVHPHDARSCSEKVLTQLAILAADEKVVAWGETGLDFNRMHSSREDQERWFIRQLEMADHLNLPLIFHERDSEGRLLALLGTTAGNHREGVVHCFSGTESELDRYLEMGFYIGVTGIVTIQKRGAPLRQLIPRIPAHRLLVETDAPYLTPTPQRNRHRRNEPAFVRQVLLKVAEVRGEDPEVLAEKVWENTCRLFRISYAPSDAAPPSPARRWTVRTWERSGGSC